MDPVSMNPEQRTSTPTKQDLLNEEMQKLAMKSHLEVQQREDIRRDLAERMKFVPPDLRVGESVLSWQEDPSKIQQGGKSGKWLKVEIIAVKAPMAVFEDLEELLDSRERTGVPVPWLSFEGQMDVCELFSDNSYLSAILDRQGLLVAAPEDLGTKKA